MDWGFQRESVHLERGGERGGLERGGKRERERDWGFHRG